MKTYTGIILVALMAAAAVGCESTPPYYESNRQAIDDSTITADVKAALVQNPVTRSRNISVNTVRGTVELSGFVDSRDERLEAAQIAGRAAGVVAVRNELQISVPAELVATASDDAGITAEVRDALAANADTEGSSIEVTTSHGVVQLAGFVNSNQARDVAANVASSVQGVRAVDNDLRLTPPE